MGKLREDGTLDTRQWDVFVKRMEDSNILTKKITTFARRLEFKQRNVAIIAKNT